MYEVIDCETNIKNKGEDAVGKMKANPHCPLNFAVWWGRKDGSAGARTEVQRTHKLGVGYDVDLLVGHNIKFDLMYAWKASPALHQSMYSTGIRIWCTQLAEYLLTGQDTKWASLDQLSEKYGGTLKDSAMKEYWDSGVDTEDIPEEEIVPYLMGDIDNTELVFLAQVKKAMEMEMLPLIMTQMEALLATSEMEYNGMAFDSVGALTQAVEMSKDIRELELQLEKLMSARGLTEPNPASSHHISCYLFGGTHSWIEDLPVMGEDGVAVRYKSGARVGEIKTVKTKVVKAIPQALKPNKAWANKEGYSVANDVLTELERGFDSCTDPLALVTVSFVKKLIAYRTLTKDVKTYYVGFSKLTWPSGFIHGNFNHCNTNTGRLSSSAPNLQNVTTKGE